MTKSVFFFFLLSLLLVVATASPGNATSGLSFDGCAPGSTIGECITVTLEEDDEEAVVRRILRQDTLGYGIVKGQNPTCGASQYGNCLGNAKIIHKKPCTYYNKCKRYGDK